MSPINFGPAKLLAMVTGLAPPEKRPLLENLMRQYADRQIDRAEMHESMTSIAGEDVVLKAMRILVPGYDEMMGRQAEAPSASSTAPPTVPDDGVDGLRKGFLSGTRLGSDGAQSGCSSAGTAAAGSKPASAASQASAPNDPVEVGRMLSAQRADMLSGMRGEALERELHNEHVMAQAKQAGNQGNIVLTPSGRMEMYNDEAFGSCVCGRYVWAQNETELSVTYVGRPGLRSKDVKFTVGTRKLELIVDGETIVSGALHRSVCPDDCYYALEDEPAPAGAAEGGARRRRVVVTLVKAERTGGVSHWTCVVEGEAEVDTSAFGPAVISADPCNPNEVAKGMDLLRGRR